MPDNRLPIQVICRQLPGPDSDHVTAKGWRRCTKLSGLKFEGKWYELALILVSRQLVA